MDNDLLIRKFERMGARLKVEPPLVSRWNRSATRSVSIDIREDRHGEFFQLRVDPVQVDDVDAIDVQQRDRHLLLLVRARTDAARLEKQKYLCGHDERHWFVAAVPEAANASTVKTAKTALKPALVREAEARAGVPGRKRDLRKTAAFVRQGEWFFLPRPATVVDPKFVLRHEPLRRGAGKPHWADEAFREGGQRVYVHHRYPNGITEDAYRKLIAEGKEDSRGWRIMVRDARVMVRGRIRHPDHRTVVLHHWHEVVMNTENQASAMRHVAFLD